MTAIALPTLKRPHEGASTGAHRSTFRCPLRPDKEMNLVLNYYRVSLLDAVAFLDS